MKISYAITVCNELKEITILLNFLLDNRRPEDEIVVLFDKGKGTAEVWDRILELKEEPNTNYVAATFKHHFADWKNQLSEICSGDYIFQIDADEVPNRLLIRNLPKIIESNPSSEVYLVPRVNTVKGILDEHVQKWGWKLNEEGWVNFPDWQMRLYQNKETIYWIKPVHEQLKGYTKFANLPAEEKFALYHPKDIGRQEKQNAFYETI